MNLVAVFYDGEHVDTCDADDDCKQYGTDRCGGCGGCLLLQASHYGCELLSDYGPVEQPKPRSVCTKVEK